MTPTKEQIEVVLRDATPWHIHEDSDGMETFLCDKDSEVVGEIFNANHCAAVALAVNSYEPLREALRQAISLIEPLIETPNDNEAQFDTEAREWIAKAKELGL